MYEFGQDVTIGATFNDANGDPVDPSTSITVKHRSPAGVTTTWIYLTDAEVTRVSQGVYEADVPTGIGGSWPYEWTGVSAANTIRAAAHFVEKDSTFD